MREGPFRRPLSFLWEAALGTVLNSAPAVERPLLSEDASLTANEPARRTVGVSRCSEAGVNAGISRTSLQTGRLPTDDTFRGYCAGHDLADSTIQLRLT